MRIGVGENVGTMSLPGRYSSIFLGERLVSSNMFENSAIDY